MGMLEAQKETLNRKYFNINNIFSKYGVIISLFLLIIFFSIKAPRFLSVNNIISLLRQISLFTSEESGSVHFIFESGQLELYSTSSDLGEGQVKMPIDYSGPKTEIAFNPFFFQDILRHSKDEAVSFGFNDPYNPGIITDSSSSLFVIMPMRLNENYTSLKQEIKMDDSEEPVLT